MGGKFSHSMSDTEGVGGTPFHRPVSPYEDMLPQSGNPDLSPQLMGLACHYRGVSFWLLGNLCASVLWRLAEVHLGG